MADTTRRVKRRWIVLALFALIIAAISLILGPRVMRLDRMVKERLEGRIWALPAEVYARPLELYPGLDLGPQALEDELELAGYRREDQPAAPGAYARRDGSFEIVTRDFPYPSGLEPSTHFTLTLAGDRVTAITGDGTAEPISLIRIDPARIGSFHALEHEDRLLLSRAQLPDMLVKTLLAVEDRDFYSHGGIAPRSILRALVANLRAGSTVQGGSTLTQQLAKNFFLTHERTLGRKANEAIIALLLELHYDKETILTAYANEIFLGQDGGRAIHGFGRASRFYFRRDLADLSPEQIALLVGMIKGPSTYDPRRHPKASLQRRAVVLAVMHETGIIDEPLYRQALSEPLDHSTRVMKGGSRYHAFLDLVRRELQREYREQDLNGRGMKILTTLDPQAQRQVEQQLDRTLGSIEKKAGVLEGAVVITGRENGEILALAGSRNAGMAGFNRAIDARRPIGSLIKPAVYLAALDQGYTLTSPLQDTAISIPSPGGKTWRPQNYDRREHGQVPLYLALANSYNLATVRLGMAVGLDKVIDCARKLGMPGDIAPYPSFLLGTAEMSPLEVGQMYQTFATGGFHQPLRCIDSVLDADNALLKRYGMEVEQRFAPGAMFLLTTALQHTVSEGTARALTQFVPPGHAVAGKTGTTDNLRDSWFAGYTGDKLAVVWVGRDDNLPAGVTGAAGAMIVWGNIIKSLHPRPLELSEPPDIEWAWLNKGTLTATSRRDPDAVALPFVAGTAPENAAVLPGMEVIEEKTRGLLDSVRSWFK